MRVRIKTWRKDWRLDGSSDNNHSSEGFVLNMFCWNPKKYIEVLMCDGDGWGGGGLFLQLWVALQVVTALRLPLSRITLVEVKCVVLAVRGKRANTLWVFPCWMCLSQRDCWELITQWIGVRPCHVLSLQFNLRVSEHVLQSSVQSMIHHCISDSYLFLQWLMTHALC